MAPPIHAPLRKVTLKESKVSDAGLARLRAALPGAEIMR